MVSPFVVQEKSQMMCEILSFMGGSNELDKENMGEKESWLTAVISRRS